MRPLTPAEAMVAMLLLGGLFLAIVLITILHAYLSW